MKSVYSAAHGAEAQIVVDVLAGEGIPAHVFGAGLIGGAGELPAIGLVQVQVSDTDVARARATIEDWQAGNLAHNDLDEDPTERGSDADAPTPIAKAATPAPRWLGGLTGFALGLVCGALLIYVMLRLPVGHELADYDGDGRPEETYVYEGERFSRIEFDRNRDGQTDALTEFGEPGESTYRVDDDFDGRMETSVHYQLGQPMREESDLDGDGLAEWRKIYRHGVLWSSQYIDAATQGPGIVWRFTDGWLSESEIDSDHDGQLDRSRRHDKRGEIASSEPIVVPPR